MTVLTTRAQVRTLASVYSDWDADWVVWQVFDAGTGNGESSGKTDALNPAGPYRGLLQVWDVNAKRFGYQPEEMYEPAKNLDVSHRLWLENGTKPWPSAVKYPGRQAPVTNALEVTPDGWLTWAERMPGRPATGPGFNVGVNDVRGIFFHSAEGYAETLLSKTSQWGYYNAQYPWHLSNLLDGRLIQHYPFTARCWHASAANDHYVGMEHEGRTPDGSTVGPVLNDLQVANDRRVIASVGAWRGWAPKRPTAASDLAATLYEHTEVIRFGGSSTQCPSHRIPWDKVLGTPAPPIQEEIMPRFNATAPSARGKQAPFNLALSDFDEPIPAGTKRLRIEVYIDKDRAAPVQVLDSDGHYAFQVGWDGARYGIGEVDVSGGGFSIQGQAGIAQVGVVAVA